MTAKHNVTLLLRNPRSAKELAALISAHGAFATGGAEGGPSGPTGLVVYELGQDVESDFQRIARLLAGERVIEVFVTATTKDPDCIIRAMRAGVTEFLPWPFEPEDIRAALDRFLARRGNAQESRPRKDRGNRGRVVHVFGAKGGTGVTTVAVNAAVEAARKGGPRPTALVDARMPLGEVPLFLDFDYTYTWVEAARSLSRLDETFLESLMTRHACGLDILAAPDSLEDAEAVTPEAARTMLGHLRRMYGTVVVDGSPYLDEVSLALMDEADDILLVTVLSLPCLAGVRKLMETFENLDGGIADKVKLVINRHMSKSEIGIAEAEDLLGRPVFHTVPNDYEATMAAINQGVPLAQAAPKCAAAKALAALPGKLAPASQKAAGKGLLGKLLGRSGQPAEAAPDAAPRSKTVSKHDKAASFAIPSGALGDAGGPA